MAGYLVKPPDFPALGLLAHRLIAGHRHRRELLALSREAAWLPIHPAPVMRRSPPLEPHPGRTIAYLIRSHRSDKKYRSVAVRHYATNSFR